MRDTFKRFTLFKNTGASRPSSSDKREFAPALVAGLAPWRKRIQAQRLIAFGARGLVLGLALAACVLLGARITPRLVEPAPFLAVAAVPVAILAALLICILTMPRW